MPQEVSTVEQRTPQTQDQQVPQTQGSSERNVPRPVFVPAADIYETADSLMVMCEMPGVGPDSVDITLERRSLDDSGPLRQPAAHRLSAGLHRIC